MAEKQETIGDRVRKAREALGWGTPRLAKEVKVLTSQSIQGLESGESRGTKYVVELAKALGQDPEWLATGKGAFGTGPKKLSGEKSAQGRQLSLTPDYRVSMRQIPVVGYVQAGVWLETIELLLEDRFDIPLPIQSGFDGFIVQGLIVRGASMDLLYPHGTVLAVVKLMDLGRDPRPGERVVVFRHKHGETEATVKEYQIGKDGVARLWPRSTHPDFQSPILVTPPADDDEDLQIAYLVIGSYRPEV